MDLRCLGILRRYHKVDEALPFFGHGVAVLFQQRLEWLDHERCLSPRCLYLPRSVDEAIHEYDRGVPTIAGDDLAMLLGDDAGAVVVGEERVL